MNILTTNQYNQGVGRSKILSSSSGVGAIITTKSGYYVLISDVNQWRFIASAQRDISKVREEFTTSEWYSKAKKRAQEIGLSVLDDQRFIEFLRIEKEIPNLLCLISIPHLALNEHYNTVNVSNNPVISAINQNGGSVKTEDFMIFGTHFPKWFKNRKGELKQYKDWKELWRNKNLKMKFFAPPRDANDPVLGANKTPLPPLKAKDIDGIEEDIPLRHQLTQTNLILICANGHLSDVPWSKYLKWKSDRNGPTNRGHDLLTYDDCCTNPKLKWSESTTKSEGYSSIYIECLNCNKKENLEGINNLSPYCLGEKPWGIDIEGSNIAIPRDDSCQGINNQRQSMQLTLVTSNNVYFSNGFSSLYIPKHLISGTDERLIETSERYEKKYKSYLDVFPGESKRDFFNKVMTPEKLISDGYQDYLDNIEDFHHKLQGVFLDEIDQVVQDTHEHYRWEEYQCFMNNTISPIRNEGISFKDIQIPELVCEYFSKIQQVNELKISQVQLDFTRVRPSERIMLDGEIQNTGNGQQIFSIERNEVYVLPANETYGEGIFFGFNEVLIQQWYELNRATISSRLESILRTLDENSRGSGSRQRIISDGIYRGAKSLLIHSFSHILMRELEFSCGYPTASLKERLFISPRMSGVLIYTTEGAEGSMGGLVWQGQPGKIEDLIIKGLNRSFDCSSDPLCWESDGQGLFNLNLAACFSCSLVSETACEEWNLGLDRRILVDPVFGFFKDLLTK
ncbi:DUF1998 domain-containing protein [Gaoshiqia sediminis]|uniref:DUF1998 domain-containing protein n=1 Tax=Gaoshiqia sediminis TaxID=2986998 RepID=A0AA42C8L2_9BACT|nr:DUF1998 domain-containing protein [Gaoshiqia sediminis]MCW0481352.1 DUF1998 domain-containing protein [Gaoshiqia sediminis]